MIEEEIKETETNGNLIVGFKEVKKGIEDSKVEKVFLANNCTGSLKEDVKKTNIEVVQTDFSNKRIGTICGKPFNISVLGVSK